MTEGIVLAMHGVPPKDFPRNEMVELFGLHAKLEHPVGVPDHEELHRRHHELDEKMRTWPRTRENDPYHAASHDLAHHLREETGLQVYVGFNEFCDPNIVDAIDLAVGAGVNRVLVLTTMMTAGGEHSERDIPTAIERAKKHHPDVAIEYAWPFMLPDVAKFLAAHISHFR
jgi:sirohydrochlorin cobaltochelatase